MNPQKLKPNTPNSKTPYTQMLSHTTLPSAALQLSGSPAVAAPEQGFASKYYLELSNTHSSLPLCAHHSGVNACYLSHLGPLQPAPNFKHTSYDRKYGVQECSIVGEGISIKSSGVSSRNCKNTSRSNVVGSGPHKKNGFRIDT